MRLFNVKDSGDFAEYQEQAFKSEHDEKTLESWLEKNPQSIVEDGALLIIGRQIRTNLGSFIDLLGIDGEGNLAVLELKRGRTPRETMAQALEYASWVEGLEYDRLELIFREYMHDEALSLLQYHKIFFKLDETQGVSFNKNQRIVIVGYDISPEIRQTAVFLRKKGITTTCVEFNYFKTASKEQLMSVDLVVGREPMNKVIKIGSRPTTDKKTFIGDLDESSRLVFEAIFTAAEKLQLPIHWGAVGFSLNVDLNGEHVALIMGYPRSSAYSQTIYTYVPSVITKIEGGQQLADSFKANLANTGLFKLAGNEMKYVIVEKPTNTQIDSLLKTILDFAEQIRKSKLLE